MSDGDTTGKNRRHFLRALGATGAFTVAGCSGNGDEQDGGETTTGDVTDTTATTGDGGGGGSQELGERVPTLVMEYWAGLGGFTSFWESAAPAVQESMAKLGLDVEVEGTDYVTASERLVNDERFMNITLGGLSSIPSRLDPHSMTRWFVIDWAGGNGKANVANYASCEYSVPAMREAQAATNEERQEWVNKSQEVFSHDAAIIPVTRSDFPGAVRTDTVEPAGLGQAGVHVLNPIAYVKSTPTDSDTLSVSTRPVFAESTNHMTSEGGRELYSRLIYSTLVEYDENYELQNVLASDYSVSDDGLTYTVELKDATFHNGRAVTAEDVKWTFEYLASNNDVFAEAVSPPYESIEAVDERTVRFELEEAFPALVTKVWALWGIMPAQEYRDQGAEENPAEFSPDPLVGSGPYQLAEFQQGSSVLATPTDQEHPLYNPDHDIFFQTFRDTAAAGDALRAGEIDVGSELPMGTVADLEENSDDVRTVMRKSFLPFAMYMQGGHGPTKFRTFRRASAKVVDRQKANALGFRGKSSTPTDTGMFRENHPWRPPDEFLWFATDDPSGDPEAARQTLADAGWGWDDDDRLHYPPDADVSPRWPEGGEPDPADFECLDSEGEFVFPDAN